MPVPWVPAAISAGVGLVSSLVGATSAKKAAEETREFDRETQQMNFARQMHMSSTAYQRAVKDMRAAGLNPAVLYSGGGSGASGSGAAAGFAGANPGQAGISSALAVSQATKDIAESVSRTKVNLQSVKDMKAAVKLKDSGTRLNSSHTLMNVNSAKMSHIEAARADRDYALEKRYPRMTSVLRYLKKHAPGSPVQKLSPYGSPYRQ